MKIPTEQDAIRIVEEAIGEKVKDIKRFSTGTQHYVYDIVTEKRPLVARIAREDSIYYFEGAVYWYPTLKEKTVPLPNLIYSELSPAKHGFAVMIMDRVPGKDLGDVYQTLNKEQKRDLAKQIASFQMKVQDMPLGPGFGYAKSYNDSSLEKSQIDVVLVHLERSRGRITDEAIVSYELIERVKLLVHKNEKYFSAIEPRGFLDDTTTKNVIIDNGKLSGVVDADFICFGDIVQVVSLVNMALLSEKSETDYVDYLMEYLAFNDEQKKMLNLYTLLFGLDFLTSHGHAFNKDKANLIEEEKIKHLKSIVEKYLTLVN